MGPLEYILIDLGAVVLALLGVIIVRTITFKPKAIAEFSKETVDIDGDKVIDNLAQLVRCRTVSDYDKEKEDEAEFQKLIDLLPKLYPNVHEKCSFMKMPDRALLYKYEGKNHDAPAVLMSHYDVVPVNEENWEKPPFSGIVEDGVLWGRGTLDTKVTFASALYALDKLIGEGFVPENDIYLAFSGGEEINDQLTEQLTERLAMAGIEVVEARLNYLAYAPEIAAVMLRRQQADAIIAAREKIVEGAVSMVKMALDRLDDENIVELDDERKAAMVSNLLVVLCSDESAQPVLNTGTLNH